MRIAVILALVALSGAACATTSSGAKSEEAAAEPAADTPGPAAEKSADTGGGATQGDTDKPRKTRGISPTAISGVPVLEHRLRCGGKPLAFGRKALDALAACWPTGPAAVESAKVTVSFRSGAVGISGVPIAEITPGAEDAEICVLEVLRSAELPDEALGQSCTLEVGALGGE